MDSDHFAHADDPMDRLEQPDIVEPALLTAEANRYLNMIHLREHQRERLRQAA